MKILEIRNRWNWGENIHLIYEGGYGHCLLEFKDNTTWGYIDGLVVHPSSQKQGIATMLMEKAEKLIKDEGFDLVALSVEKERKWQREWYERLGYEVYDEDDELYYMRKYLSSYINK